MENKPIFTSRRIKFLDEKEILKLYKKSASVKEGLSRTPQEISESYIHEYVKTTVNHGLGIIIETEDKTPCAVLLGHKYEQESFKHTISNMTLAVDPNFLGKSLGKKAFSDYITEIKENFPETHRVELNVRQTNKRAIEIYQSVGFVIEGIMKNRILDSEGNLSDDTMMAWYRK